MDRFTILSYFLLLIIFVAIIAIGQEIIVQQKNIVRELKKLNSEVSTSTKILEEAEDVRVNWKD